MAVISSIVAGITAAATAISSAVSAAGAAIAAGWAAAGISGALGATIGTIGGTSLTLGGTLAAVGTVAGAATTIGTMYKSSRASAAAQQAQMKAIQQLSQENETGQLEVNKTATGLSDNSRINRTLSSLRISMLPQNQDNQQITQNVYGVDTNQVTTATQNMTGLNIVAA